MCSKMSKLGSYKSLMIEQKIKVLKCIDEGDSVQSVLRNFGISKSTFYDIKKADQQLQIFHWIETLIVPVKLSENGWLLPKRLTLTKLFGRGTYKQRAAGVPICGIELQTAVERFATQFQNEDFKASTGWLFRFRNRHGIANRSICGELLSADHEAFQTYKDKFCLLYTSRCV